MEKKMFNGKVIAYLGLGFAALAAEMYIERIGAFEDLTFICGMLNGAAILLLLHGIYFLASGFARLAKKDESSEDAE